MQHVKRQHPDLVGKHEEVKKILKLTPVYVDNPLNDYVAQIIQKKDYTECIICFCEFELGQVDARLPCLCYYHKDCIESWFTSHGKRECPVHRRD